MDKNRRRNAQKIIVAMSGGADSSVAAALLKRAGFEVVGVFMKFWSEPEKDGLIGSQNRCCSPEAEKRARQVAAILAIPFYVFNFEKEFKKRIVDYFLREYKAGRTPNPCVVCNKEIKFGLLMDKALKLGADYVATGHYARLSREILNHKSQITNCRHKLFRGKDKNKDQSYFLWKLSQKQLKHILFPVGNYAKIQVRKLAKKFKLPVLDIPESQDICFIKTTLNAFLAKYIRQKPGPIVCALPEGAHLGQHQGLPFYTIGQRKGIELPGGPFYVVKKDLKRNTLIVSSFRDKNLYKKQLIAKDINWVFGHEPQLPERQRRVKMKRQFHRLPERQRRVKMKRQFHRLPLKIEAQLRYGHKAVSALVTKKLKHGKIELKFARPQRAITPGQSIVFYHRKELLGGGIIC